MYTDSYRDLESSSMHIADSDTTLLVTNDFNAVQTQRRLLAILTKLINSEVCLFNYTKPGGYKENRIGRLLDEAVSSLSELQNSICEYQRLHPTITLFSNTLEAHNPSQEATSLDKLLKFFREEANSVGHKRNLRNFERAASKNLKGALNYVDHLFENHSRLLVIRIDLSYQKEFIKNKSISTDVTRLHRKNLFKQVHIHPLFKHFLGYIWKLEYGQYKGFHYHTCFFFNGSKVKGDVTLARRIGEFWRNEITDGKGLYFNCNAVANKYAELGIGDIHYSNQEKRSSLQKTIAYLTKVDTAVRLTLPQGGRTFGRGERILKTKDKRGRRRNCLDI